MTASTTLDRINGVMMAPHEVRGDFNDKVANARSQLTLGMAAHVISNSEIDVDRAADMLTQLRNALARKYEVFRRVGEVISVPANANWLVRSPHGFSVRWCAASDAPKLHDIQVFTAANDRDWQREMDRALLEGFALDDVSNISAPVICRHSVTPWRLIGLFRSDRHTVDLLLVYNHSVADGTSSLRLGRDLTEGLNCLLAGGDLATLWTPVVAPPAASNVLFGDNLQTTWTEWLASCALAAALRFIPKTVLAGDIPGIQVKAPFTSRMIYTEPCSRDDWTRLFANMKSHNVKLQATMQAAAVFLCATTVASRRPGVGTSKPITFDVMTPATMREPSRVLPGHTGPSKDAVGLTVGMGSVAAKINAGDTFWQHAQALQSGLDEGVKPYSIRFATTLLLQLIGHLNATAATSEGAVIATLDPINLGRGVHSCQFEHCRALSMHLAQKSPPTITAAFGFIWPWEVNGQASFSMEYCEQLWSEGEANHLLQLFLTVLFNPPSETFGEFAAAALNPKSDFHIFTKLK